MAQLFDGVHVRTFEEWKALPGNELSDLDETCYICDGEGKHRCECGHSHECAECDGSGTTRDSQDARKVYEKELRDEIERMKDFINGFPTKHPLFIDDGQEDPEHTGGALIALKIGS